MLRAPPPIATKTILSERLNPQRNWGGGGTRYMLEAETD